MKRAWCLIVCSSVCNVGGFVITQKSWSQSSIVSGIIAARRSWQPGPNRNIMLSVWYEKCEFCTSAASNSSSYVVLSQHLPRFIVLVLDPSSADGPMLPSTSHCTGFVQCSHDLKFSDYFILTARTTRSHDSKLILNYSRLNVHKHFFSVNELLQHGVI